MGPGVALFSWGPGDTIVVAGAPTEQPANASSRGGEDAPRMPAGGTELHEYRLHSPGCLWRHRRYVQRPFQLFFAEAQNEWSGCIRRTLDIGMDDSYVEKRRAILADETKQYKVRPCPRIASALRCVPRACSRSAGVPGVCVHGRGSSAVQPVWCRSALSDLPSASRQELYATLMSFSLKIPP